MSIAGRSLTLRASLLLFLSPPHPHFLPFTGIRGHIGGEKVKLDLTPEWEELQRRRRALSDAEKCEGVKSNVASSWRAWRPVTGTPRLTGQRSGCVGGEGEQVELARGSWRRLKEGESAPKRWKLPCSGDSAVQGFSSSAWEMVTKSSQQNATHVLGRIFAFWLPSFLRKVDKLLARCVCSPHISPQHSLKEHPEGPFPFYWAERLFWVYQEPVCIIEVTLRDLVCLCDINNTCFPKVTNPGPTGNLGVSEEMQD